jgi:hypothetical protein
MGLTENIAGNSADLIVRWLERAVEGPVAQWLAEARSKAPGMTFGQIEQTLALAGRKVGKGALAPSESDLSEADAVRPGWNPRSWTLADAARTSILLALAGDREAFGETYKNLCRTADLATLLGLYRALPLFPASQALDWQIGEGLRTSIQAVFEAIAHDNPVPAETFSEHRWNHMVLKALFIDSTLGPIVGLDERRNAALAETLVDHVHERRAAGRAVDLQVWRCIAPFAEGAILDDIAPLIESADRGERLAAALCLVESPDPAAHRLLDALAAERRAVASGSVTWQTLAA